MSGYPVGAATLAANPQWGYLFNPGLAVRPPDDREQAAYDNRYDYPEWRPVAQIAEQGAALAAGIIAPPAPADAGDATAVIPVTDALTETFPAVIP